MRTSLRIDSKLLEKFQKAVIRRYGKLKGAQSTAISEAVKLWLSYSGEIKYVRVFGGNFNAIIELEDLAETVKDALVKGFLEESDLTAVPLFFVIEDAERKNVISSFQEIFGEFKHEDNRLVWTVDGGKLVLKIFSDEINVGVRKEVPGFKDIQTKTATASAQDGETGWGRA
ncbi:MAG: hypothetical protein QXJ62_04920 [Nitrososphaeria archaeon]